MTETDGVLEGAAAAPGEAAPEEAAPELTVQELLQKMLTAQAEHRAEVQALRTEIAKNRAPVQFMPQIQKSPEQLYEERVADIRDHSYYCYGCGKLSKYPKECSGKKEAPHPPMEMISVEELLSGDPSQHTPAPATVNLG